MGDFGLSTKAKSAISKSGVSVVGTDCYMPPEIRDGSLIVTKNRDSLKPIDIWCIGLVLYELVTLIPIWELNFDICIKLMTDSTEVFELLDKVADYDKNIISLIKKCLIIDPTKRPQVDSILKSK